MKTILFLLVLCITTATVFARDWTFSGDLYAGGGGTFSTFTGMDGTDDSSSSAFGEGALTLAYNNGYWYSSLFSEVIRDDYFTEINGKLSLSLVDNFLGNYRFYTSYSSMNDITDVDSDSGILSVYVEGLKHLSKDVSVNVNAYYSSTAYANISSFTPDSNAISGSASLNYHAFTVRLSTERMSYDDTILLPDYVVTKGLAAWNYYSDTLLSYTTLTYQTKEYDFITYYYRPYNRMDINTRTGYRMSAYFVPYLLGTYVSQSEDVPEYYADGSYTLWKIGAEINAFAYPLTVSARIGRQTFELPNLNLENRDFDILTLEAGWSYWGDGHSLVISDKFERFSYDRMYDSSYDMWLDGYDKTVNNASILLDYDLSETMTTEIKLGMDSYDYSTEDAVHATYTQYSAGVSTDYRIAASYTMTVAVDFLTTRYATYTDNDASDVTVKSFINIRF